MNNCMPSVLLTCTFDCGLQTPWQVAEEFELGIKSKDLSPGRRGAPGGAVPRR